MIHLQVGNGRRAGRTAFFVSLVAASMIACAGVAIGCSGSDKASGTGSAKLPEGARAEAIEHEACDEKANRVETLDSNNDGKNDIRRVYDKASGREVCRIVDLNHDGKPDLYEYFDANGLPRRREYAYDDSGVVNVIEYYEGGKLVRREYDTTGQHRIDTWDYFDPAKPPNPKTGRPMPVKRERDTNGDGRVDQWWFWEGEKVTISFDKSGDGKPDPEATIVLNDPDAGAAPPPMTMSSSTSIAPSDAGSGPQPSGTNNPTPTSTSTSGASDAGTGTAPAAADAGKGKTK